MSFREVLVLGAHPDDEMGCAGLVYQLAESGASIRALAFSRCEDLNGPELMEEWGTGLSLLGVQESSVMDLPNRGLPEYRQEILDRIEHERIVYNPDLILCPSSFDTHQDHATVAAEAKRAFKGSTVLGYELPYNHVGHTDLNAFIRLTSDAMDAKQIHASAFKSQSTKPYMSPGYIEGLARVRGLQAGTLYAEAYEVIRWIL